MIRKFVTVGLLSTVLLAGPVLIGSGQGGGAALAQTAAPDAPATTAAEPAAIVDMELGAKEAPVTVIEYASFTCPHCAHFSETVFKDLKKNYIDTGKIRYVYREVYFDRYGLWASMMARCGGGDRFFGMADVIYSSQKEWLKGDDPATIVSNLRKIGRTAGLSDAQLDTCMSDAATAQGLVNWYEQNAARDNIKATPSFIINGAPYSNMSYEDFAKAIDEKSVSKN